MIEAAALWISHTKLMFERTGGMTVLERQLWTLKRAGFTKIWIATSKPDDQLLAGLRFPTELTVSWIAGRSLVGTPIEVEPPYVGVSGDHFLRTEILTHIRTAGYRKHIVFEDEDENSIVQVIPFRTEDTLKPEKQSLQPGTSIPLSTPIKNGPAPDWVLATGFKPSDGFMARNFDRYISLTITRFLLDTPVSPNIMTLFSALVGLVGCTFFLSPGPASAMAGAVLIWIHSVLDGCDGELARIRFQETPRGADIDFWADNLVHLGLFGALAVGFFREAGSVFPLILGASASVGILGSSLLAFRSRLARRRLPSSGKAADDDGLLGRIETILAQRDFIYLLLIMAYLDLTYYFLWAGAVGAPLFMILMLGVSGSSPATPAENA